jgi:fucose permease
MSDPDAIRAQTSAKPLTFAAHAAFVPIGIVTVLLAPLLPTLSVRWSLNYSQAGALFTAQYIASTLATALSGFLVTRWGFRFAIKAGLLVMAVALALLLAGSQLLGIVCIAGYGAGLGLAVPAANLLVAEVNPLRRSAALNLLNFSWSAGSVACPFLVAAAAERHRIPLLLAIVAGFLLLVAIGIALMPSTIVEPVATKGGAGKRSTVQWHQPSLLILAILFFLYVGTENGFGGWVASYSKSLGSMSLPMALLTPSFFYSALMLGRWLAPFALRRIDDVKLAQAGLLLAFVGMLGLEASRSLVTIVASASVAGIGLSTVYPITISLLSREFGPTASRVGSLMFFVANLGGGSLPWMVGVASTRFGTLKAGLAVPVVGSAAMYVLYLRNWKSEAAEKPALAAES